MSPDKGLKHKPFSSLRGAVQTVDAPAPKPAPAPAAAAPLGRVVVRQELLWGTSRCRVKAVELANEDGET